jgi:hypothetical protein
MKEAKSLFKAGARIKAEDVIPESVQTLRLVCCICLEPVFLVRRGDSCFFSHWPRTEQSPECSIRTEWDGVDRGGSGESRLENSFDNEPFEARVCSQCGQIENQGGNFILAECYDCSLLLCPKCRERCDKCDITLCAEDARRHRDFACPDCGQSICETIEYGYPDFCIVCDEEICAECYRICEACSEPVCDDCFHDEWICAKCGEDFCETRCESESIEKVECPKCNEPFCSDCADSNFIACNGCREKVCENCREECAACNEAICNDCVSECRGCGDKFCPGCLEEHEHDCLNDI